MHLFISLESTKIYIKIHTKMLLHISVCDHHQGAHTWAWLKLQLLKMFVKNTSLCTCSGVAVYVRISVWNSVTFFCSCLVIFLDVFARILMISVHLMLTLGVHWPCCHSHVLSVLYIAFSEHNQVWRSPWRHSSFLFDFSLWCIFWTTWKFFVPKIT